MIKAVIFDLDDTLYNEQEYVHQGFRHVAEFLSQKVMDKDSDTSDRMFRRMCELLEEQGRGRIFNVICEEWQLDVPIKELVAVYRDTTPKLSLYEDGEQLLKYLKSNGFKIGIITDGCSQVQHHKLEALPLEKWVDVILATDDLGKDVDGKPYSKPNPYVYQWVLSRLGCIPQEAVYVGDNPQKDFVGAKKLGLKTVRIIREIGDHMKDVVTEDYEADALVNDLEKLKDYITIW